MKRVICSFLLAAALPAVASCQTKPPSGEAPRAAPVSAAKKFEKVRGPAVAGLFYPNSEGDLKREVDRLLAEAREQAVREASQTEIVKIAEHQAQDIVDDARRQAREARLEMEDWADSMLASLEVNLDRFLAAVKRGRERLQERSQETVGAGIGPSDGSGDDLGY